MVLQENENLHCHGIGYMYFKLGIYMVLRASANVLFFVKGNDAGFGDIRVRL